jgi:RNA polymerase sigma-70 factor, ECF subfamily
MLPTDSELISAIAARDSAAFADFYDRFSSRVYGLIFHIVRNRTDADDVLQETFWQVWRQAERFSAYRASVETWVLMLARSRAVDQLRKRRDTVSDALPERATDAINYAENTDESRRVQLLLNDLPQEQEQLIRLAFFEGLTHEQIATQLAIPLGTVKTRIRTGLHRMRDRLGQRDRHTAHEVRS